MCLTGIKDSAHSNSHLVLAVSELRGVATALSLYGFLNSLGSSASWRRVFDSDYPVSPPPGRVSVVVPGWCEPPWLLWTSLSSLRSQRVVAEYPSLFEYIFVGCTGVDLDIPRSLGYRILCAPRGKLNARHLGTLHSTGDIIVAADADSYYPPNWLTLLLEPFSDPGVVATTTPTWQGWLEPAVYYLKLLVYANKMSGRGSAYRREAYFKTGGFNLAVDQSNIRELQLEEEILFHRRLTEAGRVVYVDAPVIHLGGAARRGLRAYPRGKRTYAH